MSEFSAGFALLLEHGIDPNGRSYTLTTLAEASGVSVHALHNLLHGKAESPKLSTARAICAVYELTLDYFDCDNADQCRAMLDAHYQHIHPLVGEIAQRAALLSPDEQQSLSTLMDWIERGKPESR